MYSLTPLKESDHSIVCRGTRNAPRASGPFVSCLLRMCEVDSIFDAQPQTDYITFLQDFNDLSKADSIAKRLSFVNHPLWARATEEKMSNRKKMELAQSIMYSLDSVSQYDTMQAVGKARKKHRAWRDKQEKNWRKQFRVGAEKFSEKAIERLAMADHMQSRLIPGKLYSMPMQAASFPSLAQSLTVTDERRRARPVADRLQLRSEDDGNLQGRAHEELVLAAIPDGGTDDSIAEVSRTNVFFRVTTCRPSNHRRVALPAASAAKLSQYDMCVTVHSVKELMRVCW